LAQSGGWEQWTKRCLSGDFGHPSQPCGDCLG
jgi:hypothetical protein